jgi:uncharacterized protein
MDNLIVWADIPVTDLERAMKFYGAVLRREFITMPGMEGIGLPGPDPGEEQDGGGPMPVAFDLAQNEQNTPSETGVTIYLESNGDPEGMLQRVVEAGGEVLMPVTDMGEMVGRVGFFRDSEGNRIGVHAAHA